LACNQPRAAPFDGMTLRVKTEGWFQLAGAVVATLDLAGCVGHPGAAAIFMITSIYLVATAAWNLAS
jgi:hypothetical protein